MMDMTKIKGLKKWDIQDHLNTPEDISNYLEAAFETGDPKVLTAALGDAARAKGMSSIARKAGVTREALYKSLSENGDPKLETLFGVMAAMGLRLSCTIAAE